MYRLPAYSAPCHSTSEILQLTRETKDRIKALGEAKVVVPDESLPSSFPDDLADDLALLSFSSEKAATIVDAAAQTDEDSVVITPTAPPGLNLDETATTIASAEHTSMADNAVDAVRCSKLHVDTQNREDDLRLYSVVGLSPLDAYILPTELPDALLVHDLHNITGRCPDSRTPVRYLRAEPIADRPDRQQSANPGRREDDKASTSSVAHLYLAQQNRLGTGNHSTVFRAPFVLELDRGSGAVSRVSVAAKTTSAECGAHYMLHQEAVMYSTFPADLMDANGPDSPSGIRAAAPEAQEDMPADDAALAKTDQRNVASTEENRLPPVVPRFYGYYLPIGDDDTLICNTHSKCKEDGKCEVDWPSRILLVEECGAPIEPRDWTYQQRLECLSLYHRLHEAGFIQYSAYRRNILVQPGPLSVPRKERSFAAPSFRIIDFGRGEYNMIEREDGDGRRFERWVAHDVKEAKYSLELD